MKHAKPSKTGLCNAYDDLFEAIKRHASVIAEHKDRDANPQMRKAHDLSREACFS